VMTEELEPLFPFESRPGLPVAVAGYTLYPPDYTQQALLRLSFAYGVYFFDYQDTQAVQRTLTFDPDTKGWVPYNYSPGISLHYEEEGNANPQTICGATDGTLYTVSSAQSDNNVAFSCVVVTPSDDQGETRARKQYGDLMLDYSLATAPVPVVPYIPGISGYSPGYIPVGGGPSYSPQNGLYYYGTASDNNITRTVQVTAGNMFDINQGNSFTAYYLVVQVYLALGQGSGGIVTITGTGFSVSIPFSANLPDPTRPGNYYCTPIIYALGTAKLLPANSNLTFLLTGLHDPGGFGFAAAYEVTNAPVLMGNSGVFV
jgi:hypothetical protein